MIAVVDYDTGNTRSVGKALTHIGLEHIITADPAIIRQSDGIILPGVGAFAQAMANMKARGLDTLIKEVVQNGKPLLGVCVGMQLLFDSSTEYGETRGLGLIPGRVERLPESNLKVPHMGWNQLESQQDSLFNLVNHAYVYYVHSYYAVTASDYILASSGYGVKIPGIVQKNNVFGTQFHPEKSGDAGFQVLKLFKEVVVACSSSQQSI